MHPNTRVAMSQCNVVFAWILIVSIVKAGLIGEAWRDAVKVEL